MDDESRRGAAAEVVEVVDDRGVVELAELDGWLAGRSVCPDSATLVVPLLGTLGRGDPPPSPPHTGE